MSGALIVVLSDGETYTDASGCAVYAIPEGLSAEQIEEALAAGELETVATFT